MILLYLINATRGREYQPNHYYIKQMAKAASNIIHDTRLLLKALISKLQRQKRRVTCQAAWVSAQLKHQDGRREIQLLQRKYKAFCIAFILRTIRHPLLSSAYAQITISYPMYKLFLLQMYLRYANTNTLSVVKPKPIYYCR